MAKRSGDFGLLRDSRRSHLFPFASTALRSDCREWPFFSFELFIFPYCAIQECSIVFFFSHSFVLLLSFYCPPRFVLSPISLYEHSVASVGGESDRSGHFLDGGASPVKLLPSLSSAQHSSCTGTL